MLWISKDSSFTMPTILEPHARKIKFLEKYRFIDAMFDDGFEAREVLELCDDWDMDRVSAVVLTQCWLILNQRKDEFEINCTDAERFFNSDGTIKVAEYLATQYTLCYMCGDGLRPYSNDSLTPGLCEVCATEEE